MRRSLTDRISEIFRKRDSEASFPAVLDAKSGQAVLLQAHALLASDEGGAVLRDLVDVAQQSQLDKNTAYLLRSIGVLPTGIPIIRFDSQRALSKLLSNWIRATSDGKAGDGPSAATSKKGVRLRSLQEIRRRSRRPCILFLGPNSFREEVWDIRVKYLLPDLYGPLSKEFDIIMLVPDPPRHAVPGLLEISERFSVDIYSFTPAAGPPRELSWLWAANLLVAETGPTHITNMQGHTFFGPMMAQLKAVHNFEAVLRVAGDEVMAQIGLGTAKNVDRIYELLLAELYMVNRVDTLITMSKWEERRINSMRIDRTSVELCSRGVDVRRFRPRTPPGEFEALQRSEKPVMLYLGRRSAEKGFDRVEEIANLASKAGEPLQVAFAGPGFDPGVEDNRVYMGFVSPDKLPALLSSVDAIVLLSMTESLGQVVLEALSCGKLCFVGDEKYLDAFEGCPGIIVLPPEPELALKRISEVLAGGRVKDDLSAEIREYAVKHLDNRLAERQYLNIFRRGSGASRSEDIAASKAEPRKRLATLDDGAA